MIVFCATTLGWTRKDMLTIGVAFLTRMHLIRGEYTIVWPIQAQIGGKPLNVDTPWMHRVCVGGISVHTTIHCSTCRSLTFSRSTDTRTEAHHGQVLIARFKKSSRLLAAHPERDLSTTNSGAASEKKHRKATSGKAYSVRLSKKKKRTTKTCLHPDRSQLGATQYY